MNQHEATGLQSPGETRRSLLLVFLLLAGLGLLTTAGCLTAPFLFLDDATLVSKNPVVCGDQSWWEAFTGYYYFQYIPLTSLSYRFNAVIFGLDAAWSFRLVNGLLHAGSAFLVWRIIRSLGWGRKTGLVVACAWAVHPMACETVAWIAERNNALSFFFGALSFWAYVKWHGQWRGVIWAVVALLAALLSKPIALGWLPVFVSLELLGGPLRLAEANGLTRTALSTEGGVAQGQAGLGWRMALARLAPLLVLAVTFTHFVLAGYEVAGERTPPGGTWFTALLTDTDLFLRYVWNILVPVNLSAMYATRAIYSLADVRLWTNLATWVFLIVGSVAMARSRRGAVFCWLWYLGGLGPVCNLVSCGYPMQDRFAYLSSVGFLLLLVEAITGIAERSRGQRWMDWTRARTTGPLVGVLFICMLTILTLQRAPLWGDGVHLMQQAVVRQPDGVLPHEFLAAALEGRAIDCENAVPPDRAAAFEWRCAAVRHLTMAIDQPDAYICDPVYLSLRLGRNLLLTGKSREAIVAMEKSLPDMRAVELETKGGRQYVWVPSGPHGFSNAVPLQRVAEVHIWLGEAYLLWAAETSGPDVAMRADRALGHVRMAIQLDPLRYEAYALMAKTFLFMDALGNGSEEEVRLAQRRVAVVTRQLDRMGVEAEIPPTLAPPVSSARLLALGCLAMSRAALEAAQQTTCVDEMVNDLKNGIAWTQRAAAGDPNFGEAFWLQALACRALAERIRTLNPGEAAQAEAAYVKALKSIRPDSPRHTQAQALLVTVKARTDCSTDRR